MALVVPGPLSRTCEGRGLRPGRPALLGLYLGLAVLVRSDAKEPVLRAVVQQARSLLPAPS